MVSTTTLLLVGSVAYVYVYQPTLFEQLLTLVGISSTSSKNKQLWQAFKDQVAQQCVGEVPGTTNKPLCALDEAHLKEFYCKEAIAHGMSELCEGL